MVSIKNKKNINNEFWQFVVEVEDDSGKEEYTVDLEADYWRKLTGEEIDPEVLIIKSFEFLLEREPKESILKKFNIEVINKYFPEYESAIKDMV